MKIGDRIKQRRLELGYSVDEVADRLGKNRATIYRYENNEIENLPITILEPLARILDTTPSQLIGWDSSQKFSEARHIFIRSLGYELHFPSIEYLDGTKEQAVSLINEDGEEVFFSEIDFENLQLQLKESIDFFFWKQKRNGHPFNEE